jgi:heavy metal sensor kinase
MSLRLRLTLIFSALLSGVVLLLSIVVYSMVSVVMVNQVDDVLQKNADIIVEALQADILGELQVNNQDMNIPNTIYYQIFSDEGVMEHSSENTEGLASPMDAVAIEQDQTVFRDVEIMETPYRVLTVPLETADTRVGWLQVGLTMTDLRYTQRLLLIVFGISALFSILIAGVLGWLVTGQALEPLKMMARITDRITSTDDLSQRIPVNTTQHDEIRKLVLTFNKTLVRLERLFNVQRRFLADVSHELRTPLTVIKGNVGLMRMMNAFDEESLRSIESEVDRLTRLVKDLLLMTQAETGKLPLMLETVELDVLLFEVFEQMKILSAGVHDIQIGNIEPAVVTGDRDRLKQVLLNLGSNAIKFSPDNGRITLCLHVKKKRVVIAVSDEGPGIDPKERNYLFQRFYRGDKSRSRTANESGFGLGLPIAYWIIRSHGGNIDVESEVGKGTTFSVWLPISQSEIPTRPMRQMPEVDEGED